MEISKTNFLGSKLGPESAKLLVTVGKVPAKADPAKKLNSGLLPDYAGKFQALKPANLFKPADRLNTVKPVSTPGALEKKLQK